MEMLYSFKDGFRGSVNSRFSILAMKKGISAALIMDSACLLPVTVYDSLGTFESGVDHWVVRPLELGGLVTDELALPNQVSLISDVDVEADVILDKGMGVGDHVCHLTS